MMLLSNILNIVQDRILMLEQEDGKTLALHQMFYMSTQIQPFLTIYMESWKTFKKMFLHKSIYK